MSDPKCRPGGTCEFCNCQTYVCDVCGDVGYDRFFLDDGRCQECRPAAETGPDTREESEEVHS